MSGASASSPSFMIAPLPNCFSIWLIARSIARSRLLTSVAAMLPLPLPRENVFKPNRTRLYPFARRPYTKNQGCE